MKCSPSSWAAALTCDLVHPEAPSPLILAFPLGSCTRESTLPKYLLVLLLPACSHGKENVISLKEDFSIFTQGNV